MIWRGRVRSPDNTSGISSAPKKATSLVSLISDTPVKKQVSMTGEITLRGQVMPVGGIKEKMLAAHRAGIKTVILPKRNEPDVEDVPEEVRKALHFVFAESVNDVIKAALDKKPQPGRKKTGSTKKESTRGNNNNEKSPSGG